MGVVVAAAVDYGSDDDDGPPSFCCCAAVGQPKGPPGGLRGRRLHDGDDGHSTYMHYLRPCADGLGSGRDDASACAVAGDASGASLCSSTAMFARTSPSTRAQSTSRPLRRIGIEARMGCRPVVG